MPAFYPRQNMPRQQLPPTPPEFVPGYNSGCGAMPYQRPAYTTPSSMQQQQPPPPQPQSRHDDGHDFVDRYGQLAIAMPPMYPQAGTYLSAAPPSLPPSNGLYELPGCAPILPPMRMQNGLPVADPSLHQQQHQHQQRAQELAHRPQQQVKEEKPVGGVSAKLDYDMDVMTDFVCEMALQVITPGRMMPPSFRKWVHQVLCATRLPSATILLSMFYLSSRMPMLAGISKTDSHLFRLLTIALVLGSKFLDDNTFINRSWAEVSGIPVGDLNQLEMEWLVAIEFTLHRDPAEQQGWVSWSDHWKDYQGHAAVRATRAGKLSPLDTSVQRPLSMSSKPLPPLPPQQAYNLPPCEFTPKSARPAYNAAGYMHHDPWRSTQERSPASAPITGPTTPEYYGTAGPWAPEGYSRRTMFGFPPMSQPAIGPPSTHQPSNYGPPAYNAQYQSPPWNSHGPACACVYCAHRHPKYMMPPGFAPQAVAV